MDGDDEGLRVPPQRRNRAPSIVVSHPGPSTEPAFAVPDTTNPRLYDDTAPLSSPTSCLLTTSSYTPTMTDYVVNSDVHAISTAYGALEGTGVDRSVAGAIKYFHIGCDDQDDRLALWHCSGNDIRELDNLYAAAKPSFLSAELAWCPHDTLGEDWRGEIQGENAQKLGPEFLIQTIDYLARPTWSRMGETGHPVAYSHDNPNLSLSRRSSRSSTGSAASTRRQRSSAVERHNRSQERARRSGPEGGSSYSTGKPFWDLVRESKNAKADQLEQAEQADKSSSGSNDGSTANSSPLFQPQAEFPQIRRRSSTTSSSTPSVPPLHEPGTDDEGTSHWGTATDSFPLSPTYSLTGIAGDPQGAPFAVLTNDEEKGFF